MSGGVRQVARPRYLPIAEHGLIGDLHTVALVGTDGTIDWYCCPRFDSPSVFAALLDADHRGLFRIAPDGDRWSFKQLYLPDTNIVITRFLMPDGVAEVQDFMPPPPSTGGTAHRHRMVRRVLAVCGQVRFVVDVVCPKPGQPSWSSAQSQDISRSVTTPGGPNPCTGDGTSDGRAMSEPRAPERGSERSGTGQPRRTVEDLDQPSRGVAPDHGAGDAGLRIMIRLVHMGPFLILVGFWILMSFLSPFFLETRNLSNLFLAAAIPTVLALGLLFVIITGGIDLSAGAIFVLVAVCGARFTHEVSANPIATILFMLAVGGFVGLVNGLLIEHVRIAEPFVVTLGTLSVVTGAVFLVSSGLTVTGFPTLITDIGGGSWGYVPISAVVVVVIAMAAALALRQLRWGRWVYAVGSNREAATRVGMPVRFVGTSVFVLSGLAAGVAGIFEAGLTNAGTPAVGFTAIIDAITAVVIGGAALTGGRGTVWGTLVGAIILQTIHNGMNLLRIDTNWEPVALGAVLLAAVGLEKMRAHLETRLRLTAARRAGDL